VIAHDPADGRAKEALPGCRGRYVRPPYDAARGAGRIDIPHRVEESKYNGLTRLARES